MARRGVTFTLHGVRELDRALAELPRSVGKTVLRRAATETLRPVRDAARALAPRGAEGKPRGKSVATSIHVRAKLKRSQAAGRQKQGDVEAFVGSTAPHAHLVEWGSGPRYQKTTGRYTGQMPPQPFMRPAWDQGKAGMLDKLPKALWAEVYKAARRLRVQSERLVARLRSRRGG